MIAMGPTINFNSLFVVVREVGSNPRLSSFILNFNH